MFRNLVIGTLALSALAVLPALAQDLGAEREASMKEVGRNFGVVNRMNRGQTPYDAAAATEAFGGIVEAGRKFSTLFPESGDDTEIGRAIGEDRARFDELLSSFIADAEAAADTAGKGEAELKQAFSSVAANCAACHKVFRPD